MPKAGELNNYTKYLAEYDMREPCINSTGSCNRKDLFEKYFVSVLYEFCVALYGMLHDSCAHSPTRIGRTCSKLSVSN